MFATDDTIVAIATPPGRGALGVVRLSGAGALEIAARVLDRREPLQPRYATLTRVRNGEITAAPALDEVVATLFEAPHSYTGEHVVEISAHGSPVILQGVVRRAIAAGARLAQPGEFTLRAFLNGKRDLIQSEAVADLIDAATPLQARVAFDQLEGTLTQRIGDIDAQLFDLIVRLEASLDFPDEGYHFVEPSQAAVQLFGIISMIDALLADAAAGRRIREGATVVIAGPPNAGKSSVFNRLVGSDRAIVTPLPGTTRDLVTEAIDVDGLAISLVDTAGWRETVDVIEREGVERGVRARGVADLVLLVLDSSEPPGPEFARLLGQTSQLRCVVVLNKSDLDRRVNQSELPHSHVLVSALNGDGFDRLRAHMIGELTGSERLRDDAAISNTRHIALLGQCRELLETAHRAAATERVPEEFVLADLQAARIRLDEIVGRRTSDDVLRRIFERFCIGK